MRWPEAGKYDESVPPGVFVRSRRSVLLDIKGMMGDVGRMRGWPVTIVEPALLEAPVGLRPVRVRDAGTWRDSRVRNAEWLRPWEPTNPETPLYRSTISPYVTMARTMRREARQGVTLPWVVTYGDKFAGQLTVGGIVWGSSRTAQVGYWVDEAYAGQGVIPTVLAMAMDHCFFSVGLHRVEATIRPENQASRRVVEKLGFREEGLRRRSLHIDGAWRDHLCYALTVEDVHGGLLARWRSIVQAQRSRASSG
jgi:ribosomal-protein-alanine N-acetyltransferase